MSFHNSCKIISKLTFSLCLLLLSYSSTTFAQTAAWQWRNLTPTSGTPPEARRNGVAIYDPVGNRVIVFGGTGDAGLLNDTWAFNVAARTWAKLATTGITPGARLGFDAVYDPTGHQMVIYAGQGASFFNDTWTLNLTTLAWRDVSPVNESAVPSGVTARLRFLTPSRAASCNSRASRLRRDAFRIRKVSAWRTMRGLTGRPLA